MVSTRLLLALVLIAAPPLLVASGNDTYEVWAIDQSNSPGTTYGGTLYIWDALVSFVASGHVLFIDAATRTPVDCLRTLVGAGGARQVHFAIPSPDPRYVLVANQNRKLFERINTSYRTNSFVLDTAADHQAAVRPRSSLA